MNPKRGTTTSPGWYQRGDWSTITTKLLKSKPVLKIVKSTEATLGGVKMTKNGQALFCKPFQGDFTSYGCPNPMVSVRAHNYFFSKLNNLYLCKKSGGTIYSQNLFMMPNSQYVQNLGNLTVLVIWTFQRKGVYADLTISNNCFGFEEFFGDHDTSCVPGWLSTDKSR